MASGGEGDGRGGAAKGGGLAGAVAAEWLKAATVRSTWWLPAVAAVLMVAAGGLMAGSAAASAANGFDTAMPAPAAAAGALPIAQLPLIAFAALIITGEYGSGAIRSTLGAVPLRGRMLAAKVAVVVPMLFGWGLVLAAVGTATAAALLGDAGDFTWAQARDTAVGTAAYLALSGALVVAAGTMLRSTAGTLVAMVLLLVAVPLLGAEFGAPWLVAALDLLPTAAGMHLITGAEEPYGAAGALTILAAWPTAALAAAYALLWWRDA
ncbi:hypothetical protein [Nocardiopsis trehalosi]|jgi:hypothetical protein|uniref:hypothetical protein n=1 Tax=Nocardiopsis trehalosi TaxID=109329 RepID=UPI000832E004|nr:hypothetical protein [Nocardiopsis trehalosi]